MKDSHRFIWGMAAFLVVWFAAMAGLFGLAVYFAYTTDIIWLRIFVMLWGIGGGIWLALKAFAAFGRSILYVPRVLRLRTAALLGMEIVIVVFFPTQTVWVFLSGAVAAIIAMSLAALLFTAILSTRTVRMLDHCYRNPDVAVPPVAYIAVLADKAMLARQLGKQLPSLVVGLWKHGVSTVSRIYSLRDQIEMLDPELPEDEEGRVSKRDAFTAAFKLVSTMIVGGRPAVAIIDVKDFRDRRFQAFLVRNATASIVSQPVLNVGAELGDLERIIVDHVPKPLEWVSRRMRNRSQREEQFHRSLAHYARGPVIILTSDLEMAPRGPNGLFYVFTEEDMYGGANAEIVQILRNTGDPLISAEAEAPPELLRVSRQIARNGFPTVADAYLKFRSASSDVDRFISLLDTFETVLKVLGICALNPAKGNVSEKLLAKPTLGNWVYVLRDSAGKITGPANELIQVYLRQEVSPLQLELQSAAEVCGFKFVKQLDQFSDGVDWCFWILNLRNETKGHGGTSEAVSANLWIPLHDCILEMIGDLSPLLLNGAVGHDDGVRVRGWRRGSYRQNPKLTREKSENHVKQMYIDMGEDSLSLDKYIVYVGANSFAWLKGRKTRAAYVDPLSGVVLNSQDGEFDPTILSHLDPPNHQPIGRLAALFGDTEIDEAEEFCAVCGKEADEDQVFVGDEASSMQICKECIIFYCKTPRQVGNREPEECVFCGELPEDEESLHLGSLGQICEPCLRASLDALNDTPTGEQATGSELVDGTAPR